MVYLTCTGQCQPPVTSLWAFTYAVFMFQHSSGAPSIEVDMIPNYRLLYFGYFRETEIGEPDVESQKVFFGFFCIFGSGNTCLYE